MSYSIPTIKEVQDKIWTIVHETPAFDIQTSLYDQRFDDSLLRTDLDELLTTQELTEEFFRYSPRSICDPNNELTHEEYDTLPVRLKSELIWHRLFLANTPLSEATRSALTAIGLLELDPKIRNLGAYRNFFSSRSKPELIATIITRSNLEGIVTCYNPLLKAVQKSWKTESDSNEFFTALDLTEIICDWKKSYSELIKQGYNIKRTLDKNVYPLIHSYFKSIIDKSKAVYIHLTLPSGISFSQKSNSQSKILLKCLIPVLLELKLPLSLKFTEAKSNITLNSLKLNQALQFSNLDFIDELSTMFPALRLLITDYNYKNQYGLTLLAKKYHNIMPMNSSSHLSNQSSFTEISRMHFDQLGASFIAHTSNAEVYTRLLPEWAHSRWTLAELLHEKYVNLYRTGWRVTEEELKREIYNLLAGNAKKFINIH